MDVKTKQKSLQGRGEAAEGRNCGLTKRRAPWNVALSLALLCSCAETEPRKRELSLDSF
jgi:hypothetical protein